MLLSEYKILRTLRHEDVALLDNHVLMYQGKFYSYRYEFINAVYVLRELGITRPDSHICSLIPNSGSYAGAFPQCLEQN